MAKNNTVILTGNLGAEVTIHQTKQGNDFAAFSLATRDSYKDDETGEWLEKEVIWHRVLAFNPFAVRALKDLKKGARIKVTGHLSYTEFKVYDDTRRQEITKNEVKVIAEKIEQAPLPKKRIEEATEIA